MIPGDAKAKLQRAMHRTRSMTATPASWWLNPIVHAGQMPVPLELIVTGSSSNLNPTNQAGAWEASTSEFYNPVFADASC